MNVPEENIQGKAQATNPMLSTNTESNSSLQSDQLKALAVMKDNLPEYVVESFIEAGFDTLGVISQIDTPTLEEIEQFITREFVEDVRFKCGFGVTGQFKFLPGHRRQINIFITKVKEEAISKKMKWHAQSQRASTKAPAEIQSCNARLKRRKVDVDSSLSPVSESSSSTDEVLSSIRVENQATVMAKIRQQIVKWQRQHSTDKVAKLKETVHFDVKVDVIGKDSLSLSIICNICGKKCILSSNKGHIFLSNWTRHVIKCVEKVKMPLSNMVKIKDYFRPLSNLLVSPLVLQSEGKRVPLMLSPVESLCDKSVANLPSSISKNDSLSISENPVLFDGPPCLRKNKSTGGSNDSKENSLSLNACNYSQQSIESSLSVSNNQVDINEKSTQLSVSTDESQGFLDASLSTQVNPQATQSQVIPFKPKYQSPTGSVILNKEKNHCESRRDFKDTLTSNDDTKVKPHTDWSRSTRNKLLLLKAGSHHNQTKLTSFFDLVDDVSSIMSKLPAFETGSMPLTQHYVPTKFQDMFSPLFKRLIANAETNLQKLPQQIRHDTIIKKFATSLLIYCGPMSYNFISSNLSKALPCLRTVQQSIAKEYALFQEGHFRFNELLDQLKHFNASMVVSVGEDATRVISRIEYDSETDKLVGFVLPCDQDGLPICDSFVATSFETMEKYFHNACLAKYTFVYVVQPLTKGVPPFCLACVGTNNKFNAEIVMKRWQCIHDQLNQRGIHLVSIGADGDSRELRGMLVSTQLLTSVQSSSNTSFLIDKIVIPPEWNSWLAFLKRPTSVDFVQDMVHIAVKLKTRLLKPSIILPLGNYVAGVHHLRIVQQTFCKDQHGLRERDINYKDKQNYDAVYVVRMTSESVMNLLTSVPDAKGTIAYLTIMKYINDSFLDKTLECLCRIEKAWYVVFVVHYWRQWIVRHPDYSIANNFILSNTYMCIELNAHSLLIHILSLQNLLPPSSENFLPWLLGSQCCERLFRSARSMSSTFSTIINFSISGFMRRLHRLQLQVKLESECDVTTIKYPRAEAHKSKDSQCKSSIFKPHLVTTQDITRTVENARELAKSTIQDLGMADLLKAHEDWNNPPIPGHTVDVEDGDQEDDDDGDNDELKWQKIVLLIC